jgi:hypothetical protein
MTWTRPSHLRDVISVALRTYHRIEAAVNAVRNVGVR